MYVLLSSDKHLTVQRIFSTCEQAREWAQVNCALRELYIGKVEIVLHTPAPSHAWTIVNTK